MAASFNLTAQLVMQGPVGLGPIVQQIQSQLSSINTSLNFRIDPSAQTRVNTLNTALTRFNTTLATTHTNATQAAQALSNLANAVTSVNNAGRQNSNLGQTLNGVARSATQTATSVHKARTEMEEFGRQSALAIRRFAAFSLATGVIFGFVRAVAGGIKEAISFQRELIKVAQVTNTSMSGLKGLTNEISRLSTSLGVSSRSLVDISVTLSQAGLSASQVKVSLEALAKSSLAATFGDIRDTTEGAIAIMQQFSIEASGLERALDAINAVSGKYAVESEDLISAVRRAGGVFAAMSQGVASGQDALNQFIALFTSVRATTRESAESIATGLRTIFVRLQRGSTIDALREVGIELQDLEGKFVGPYEAIKRLSEALSGQSFRTEKLGKIVEELGGFRQISKVIPLLQQFATAQEALGVAQRSQGSISGEAAKAQEALQVQFEKTKEKFLALVREITETSTFNVLAQSVLKIANSLISLADALKPILPALAALATVKIFSAGTEFLGGFLGGIKSLGGAGGAGRQLSGANAATAQTASVASSTAQITALQANTAALTSNTAALASLNSAIRVFGVARFPGLRFSSGGLVPGTGNTDSVMASLMPGEFVLRKDAVKALGPDRVTKLNKYAAGGKTGRFEQGLNISEATGKPNADFDFGAVFLQPFDAVKSDRSINFSEKDLATNFNIDVNDAKNIFGVRSHRPLRVNLHSRALSQKAADEIQQQMNGDIVTMLNNAASKLTTIFGIANTKLTQSDLNENLVSTIQGYGFEAGMAALGSKWTNNDVDDVSGLSTFDYLNGLSDEVSTKIFGYSPLSKMPVEAKRTFGDKSDTSIKKKILRYIGGSYQEQLNQVPEKRKIGEKRTKRAWGGGPTDTELAMLTPGEVVINKEAAQRIGYANLHKLNQVKGYAKGGIVGYATGGLVGDDLDDFNIDPRLKYRARRSEARRRARIARGDYLPTIAGGTQPLDPLGTAPFVPKQQPRVERTGIDPARTALVQNPQIAAQSRAFLERRVDSFGGVDADSTNRANRRARQAGGGVQPSNIELASQLRKQNPALSNQAALQLAREQIAAARATGQDIILTKSLGQSKQQLNAALQQQAKTEKTGSLGSRAKTFVGNRILGTVAAQDVVDPLTGQVTTKAGQRSGGLLGKARGFTNKLGGIGTVGLLAAPLLEQAVGRKTETAAGIGGGLSGAVSGAALGGQFGGPAGAVIGAVVGGLTGAIEGRRSQREEASQTRVDKAGAETDKAFADFLKTGSLSQFDKALAESTAALAQQTIALDQASGAFGSTGGFYAAITGFAGGGSDERSKSAAQGGFFTQLGNDLGQIGYGITEVFGSLTGLKSVEEFGREGSKEFEQAQRDRAKKFDDDITQKIFEGFRGGSAQAEQVLRKQITSGKKLTDLSSDDDARRLAAFVRGKDLAGAQAFKAAITGADGQVKTGADLAKAEVEFGRQQANNPAIQAIVKQIELQRDLANAYKASNEIGRQYVQALTDFGDALTFAAQGTKKFDQDLAQAEARASGGVLIQSQARVNPFDKAATLDQTRAGIDELRASGFNVSPELANNVTFGKALEAALPKISDDTISKLNSGDENSARQLVRQQVLDVAKAQGVDDKSVVVQQTLNSIDEVLTSRKNAGGSSGEKDLQSGDFQEALEAGAKKAADSYSAANDSIKKAFDERSAAEAKFAENLNKFADLQRKAFAASLEVGQLEINQRNALAQLLGQELTVQEQVLAERTKIGKLGVGVTGGADTSVADIVAQRQRLIADFDDKQRQAQERGFLNNPQDPRNAELGDLKAQIESNTEALQLAAKSTTTLTAVQNKFSELNQRSQAGRQFVNTLFTADFQQRLQLNRGARAFGKLTSGQGDTLTVNDRRASGEFFQQIAPLLSTKTRQGLEDDIVRQQIDTLKKTGQIDDKQAKFLTDEIAARAHERAEGQELLALQKQAAEEQIKAQQELANISKSGSAPFLAAAQSQAQLIQEAITKGFDKVATQLEALVTKQKGVVIPGPAPGPAPTGSAMGGLIGNSLTRRTTDNRFANGGSLMVADGEYIVRAPVVAQNYKAIEQLNKTGKWPKGFADGGEVDEAWREEERKYIESLPPFVSFGTTAQRRRDKQNNPAVKRPEPKPLTAYQQRQATLRQAYQDRQLSRRINAQNRTRTGQANIQNLRDQLYGNVVGADGTTRQVSRQDANGTTIINNRAIRTARSLGLTGRDGTISGQNIDRFLQGGRFSSRDDNTRQVALANQRAQQAQPNGVPVPNRADPVVARPQPGQAPNRQANANPNGGGNAGGNFGGFVNDLKLASDTFSKAIDKLAGLEKNFTVTVGGTQNVQVTINGAEVLKELEPRIRDIAIANINKAIQDKWNGDGSVRNQGWQQGNVVGQAQPAFGGGFGGGGT